MAKLTHFDDAGGSHMVDVGDKPATERSAVARGLVRAQAATWALIRNRKIAKGDVLEVARLAGIMAAKRTAELIPLCHTIQLAGIEVTFEFPADDELAIEVRVHAVDRTGVEMEALTAVSVAALTVYDMCKSVDRGLTIEQVRLEEKAGGRSGVYVRAEAGEA
jgi:cyclic pyranopterin phosphate synthase